MSKKICDNTSKGMIVFALILMMAVTFFIGLFLGKELFDNKCDCEKCNQETIKN